MKNLQRGQRFALPDNISSLSVAISAKSENLTFDVSCFGLDGKGQLSDERFFVFFNQPCAPEQCIQLLEAGSDDLAQFDVELEKFPPSIRKLVWVITVDGGGSMSALQEGRFRLSTSEGQLAAFHFTGADFGVEKALMVADLYERNGWRLSAVGQGFAGGLDAVVRHFGGLVEGDEQASKTRYHAPTIAHDLPEAEKLPCDEAAPTGEAEPALPQTPSRPVSKPVRPPSSMPLVAATPMSNPKKAILAPIPARSNAPFETVMDFSDRLQTLASRVPVLASRLLTEEATKNALVMPFIGTLGYDVFDPLEVIPEYIADYGVKKGEKVDYALVKDGKIILIFECKKFGGDLNISHASQLFRYFGVTETRVGVLTNGVHYRFFTDLEAPNKMDAAPFLEVDLLNLNDGVITELKKLTKGTFDIDQLLTGAADLKYTREIKRLLGEQLEAPTDEFVKLFASKVFAGPLTPPRREYFSGLTKRAFKALLSEIINDRLKSALGDDGAATTPTLQPHEATANMGEEASPVDNAITAEELEGFHILKAILRRFVDPKRIIARDTQSYLGVLLDDNNRKPLARLYFNRAQKYLGLFDETRDERRVAISDLNEIYDHADELGRVLAFYEKGSAE
jgi:stress response protein SCP2